MKKGIFGEKCAVFSVILPGCEELPVLQNKVSIFSSIWG
jgi:hypothetical protein